MVKPTMTEHGNPEQRTLEEIARVRRELEDSRGLHDDYERAGALSARFRDKPPERLLDMMESGTNESGKPITNFEFEALAEACHREFGTSFIPNQRRVQSEETASSRSRCLERQSKSHNQSECSEELQQISYHAGAKLLGIDKRTLRRWVDEGSFPRPTKLQSKELVRWTRKEFEAPTPSVLRPAAGE